IAELRPGTVYLNSLFSRSFSIAPLLLRRAGWLADAEFIIAPRGELHPGALALKARKKRAFLEVGRRLRLYDGVAWHATSASEGEDIRRWFGRHARVALAPNLPSRSLTAKESVAARPKRKGSA